MNSGFAEALKGYDRNTSIDSQPSVIGVWLKIRLLITARNLQFDVVVVFRVYASILLSRDPHLEVF
jgi:hypothetical protein